MSEPKWSPDAFLAALNELTDSLAQHIAEKVQARIDFSGVIRPRLLDVAAAAVYLGRSEKGARALLAQGALPVVRLDSKPQFDIRDLDAFIANSKEGVGNE